MGGEDAEMGRGGKKFLRMPRQKQNVYLSTRIGWGQLVRISATNEEKFVDGYSRDKSRRNLTLRGEEKIEKQQTGGGEEKKEIKSVKQ